jgi:hypothetical protein
MKFLIDSKSLAMAILKDLENKRLITVTNSDTYSKALDSVKLSLEKNREKAQPIRTTGVEL